MVTMKMKGADVVMTKNDDDGGDEDDDADDTDDERKDETMSWSRTITITMQVVLVPEDRALGTKLARATGCFSSKTKTPPAKALLRRATSDHEGS